MRSRAVSPAMGGRSHPLRRVAWAGVSVLLSAFLAPELWAQSAPTPAGTRIANWAEATYVGPNGNTYRVYSDTLAVVVAQVAGLDLDPPRVSVADPGATVVFQHTLTNLGNGTDSITVTVTHTTAWPVRVYMDLNANGALDASDLEVTGPLVLDMGEAVALLVAVDVPGVATVRGTIDTLEVVATSGFDATVTDSIQDLLEIRDVGIVVTLSKSVDRPSAIIGDILTYTIGFVASGTGSATNLQLIDLVPTGTSYVPGTMALSGVPLTDAAGDDAGTFDVAGNRVVYTIGAVAGGDSGTVSFQVRVDG